MNLSSAAVTDSKQKPKPESVHDQRNDPAAALSSSIPRKRQDALRSMLDILRQLL